QTVGDPLPAPGAEACGSALRQHQAVHALRADRFAWERAAHGAVDAAGHRNDEAPPRQLAGENLAHARADVRDHAVAVDVQNARIERGGVGCHALSLWWIRSG